ncbi:flavodoxin domain-containing protein [Kitasatospora sp. NPDC085879]|uniref:flavodoxin domain-containing protein n=1 Tax=Kitasatospora sp. NPDC085879 TaxID=3154769 RepID=UPI0034153B19
MTQQRVLVAYGSKHGATAGIAKEIGRVLGEEGFATEVVPAAEVRTVAAFDAVVLGSALYLNHWQRDALGCAHRHADELARRPVWLFSSGPVDSSAEQHEIPPVAQVAKELERLGARGHVTFGGSVTAETPGLVARGMVRHEKGGDFRNPEHIRRWAREIGAALRAGEDRGPTGA